MKTIRDLQSLLLLVKINDNWRPGMHWYATTAGLPYQTTWRLFNKLTKLECVAVCSTRRYNRNKNRFGTIWECSFKKTLPAELTDRLELRRSKKQKMIHLQKLLLNNPGESHVRIMKKAGLSKATFYRYLSELPS